MLASSARTFPANVRLSAKSGPVTAMSTGVEVPEIHDPVDDVSGLE
jgi:hypothetical protein